MPFQFSVEWVKYSPREDARLDWILAVTHVNLNYSSPTTENGVESITHPYDEVQLGNLLVRCYKLFTTVTMLHLIWS